MLSLRLAFTFTKAEAAMLVPVWLLGGFLNEARTCEMAV